MRYPPSAKKDIVENHHGTTVEDPYRWLEDSQAPETRAWIEEQNKLTFSYLEKLPYRKQIRDRLTQLWNFEKYSVPHREGDRYFYMKNDGLQNQYVLYTTKSLSDPGKVLIDPNVLSPDGTIAISSYSVSKDGKKVAYGLASAGSDWTEWRVRDVESGTDFPDHLRWIKFSSVTWNHDGSGFYYSRYNEPSMESSLEEANYYNKLYYHQLGTDQSSDVLIYERPDEKEWSFYAQVTEDGRYLVVTISRGTDPNYRVSYLDLMNPDARFIDLIDVFEAEYILIDNDGPKFWFKTTQNALRGRIIAIDLRRPSSDQWQEIIPEAEETLDYASVLNDRFFVSYLKDARTVVRSFDLAGKFLREVELPSIGTASGFYGKKSDRETFYSFSSFTAPSTIYRYDLSSDQGSIFRKPVMDYNPEDYQTEQIFYESKGTRIPMFLSYKKGLKPNKQTPVYLYGYGGFNVSMTPAFSVSMLVLMEMGGIFAVPNIRGGGEYGKAWHRAGTRFQKQNSFDDFIAAAEWLMEHEYTSPSKLAIGGGSNGGLLVAASMIQCPELFAAVIASVGVFDMLRFHKFTIGWAWTDDYGSPEDPEDFRNLLSYSPLHTLKSRTRYPAVLITTADHDDRVVPAHSFKFVAALQEAQAGDAPVLIRIETSAGHGAGKPTTKIIDEAADKWAFLAQILGI